MGVGWDDKNLICLISYFDCCRIMAYLYFKIDGGQAKYCNDSE